MRKFVFAALLTLVAATAAHAEDATEPVWSLDKSVEGMTLSYSVPQSDDIRLVFSCKPRSGAVEVNIVETSPKLKAGKKATAVISVGETKATVAGKLEVNEEAGAPGFTGALKAGDPLFAAMSSGKEIVLVVGPMKKSEPLKGAADKAKQFAAACAKS